MIVHVLTKHAGQYTLAKMTAEQQQNLVADFEQGTSRTFEFVQDDGTNTRLLRSQIIGIEQEPEPSK